MWFVYHVYACKRFCKPVSVLGFWWIHTVLLSQPYNNTTLCPPASSWSYIPTGQSAWTTAVALFKLCMGGISLACSRSGIFMWPSDWEVRHQVSQMSWASDGTCQLCGNGPVFVVAMTTLWWSVDRLRRLQPCKTSATLRRIKNNFVTSSGLFPWSIGAFVSENPSLMQPGHSSLSAPVITGSHTPMKHIQYTQYKYLFGCDADVELLQRFMSYQVTTGCNNNNKNFRNLETYL